MLLDPVDLVHKRQSIDRFPLILAIREITDPGIKTLSVRVSAAAVAYLKRKSIHDSFS